MFLEEVFPQVLGVGVALGTHTTHPSLEVVVYEQSVSHEVGLVPKGAVTLHAGLALLAVCGAAVDLALLETLEALPAGLTHIWPLPSVNPEVNFEVALVGKLLEAVWAWQPGLVGCMVGACVCGKVVSRGKAVATLATHKLAVPVCCHVPLQRALACEDLVALLAPPHSIASATSITITTATVLVCLLVRQEPSLGGESAITHTTLMTSGLTMDLMHPGHVFGEVGASGHPALAHLALVVALRNLAVGGAVPAERRL